MRKVTHAEWCKQATKLYGEDSAGWRFKCPSCGYVAAVRDWQAAGAGEGAVAFSCVGRWLPKSIDAFEDGGPGPCNYAGGGLIRLNPVTVVGPDGAEHAVFEFADPL